MGRLSLLGNIYIYILLNFSENFRASIYLKKTTLNFKGIKATQHKERAHNVTKEGPYYHYKRLL